MSSGTARGSFAAFSARRMMALMAVLHLAMAEHHGAQHDVFAEFLGFGFHHHHGVVRAGDDQFQLGLRHIVDRRIEDVFAVDVTDAGGADRALEGQARNRQRGARRRPCATTSGSFSRSWLSTWATTSIFIAIAVGEQRADGAVDQARDQRLAFGRPRSRLK